MTFRCQHCKRHRAFKVLYTFVLFSSIVSEIRRNSVLASRYFSTVVLKIFRNSLLFSKENFCRLTEANFSARIDELKWLYKHSTSRALVWHLYGLLNLLRCTKCKQVTSFCQLGFEGLNLDSFDNSIFLSRK